MCNRLPKAAFEIWRFCTLSNRLLHLSVAYKKHITSSSEANPLDLTQLLANDEQRKIPSNQMIMDELFSLQGYISTRMDALDAQNQQDQNELQRLSYKINMMDLDEDMSEPES
ncbi:hypothetical protein Lal_00039643 [Lupinus albus]|nr:hypothetical protein Lal_00039643 [Lupinus albus]